MGNRSDNALVMSCLVSREQPVRYLVLYFLI